MIYMDKSDKKQLNNPSKGSADSTKPASPSPNQDQSLAANDKKAKKKSGINPTLATSYKLFSSVHVVLLVVVFLSSLIYFAAFALNAISPFSSASPHHLVMGIATLVMGILFVKNPTSSKWQRIALYVIPTIFFLFHLAVSLVQKSYFGSAIYPVLLTWIGFISTLGLFLYVTLIKRENRLKRSLIALPIFLVLAFVVTLAYLPRDVVQQTLEENIATDNSYVFWPYESFGVLQEEDGSYGPFFDLTSNEKHIYLTSADYTCQENHEFKLSVSRFENLGWISTKTYELKTPDAIWAGCLDIEREGENRYILREIDDADSSMIQRFLIDDVLYSFDFKSLEEGRRGYYFPSPNGTIYFRQIADSLFDSKEPLRMLTEGQWARISIPQTDSTSTNLNIEHVGAGESIGEYKNMKEYFESDFADNPLYFSLGYNFLDDNVEISHALLLVFDPSREQSIKLPIDLTDKGFVEKDYSRIQINEEHSLSAHVDSERKQLFVLNDLAFEVEKPFMLVVAEEERKYFELPSFSQSELDNLRRFKYLSYAPSVVFGNDGKLWMNMESPNFTFMIFDPGNGRFSFFNYPFEIDRYKNRPETLVFDADGNMVVRADDGVHFFSIDTYKKYIKNCDQVKFCSD